jgi:hypothetical protein
MIAAILFFIILCSGSAFACAFSTARFEKAAPLTVFAIIVVLYLFGLFDMLAAGAWAVLLLSAALWVLAIVNTAKRHSFHAFFKRFLTPAFAFFALAFLFVLYSNYGRLVSNRDDLAHWADTVKILFQADRLATAPALSAQYQSYPPAMSLLQYLPQFIGRLFGGGFSEWLLYVAFESAVLVLFVPAFSKLDWGKPYAFRIAAMLVCACCVPGVLHSDVYRTLMIDPYLGLVAGFGFATLLLNERRAALDNATLVLACAVVTLSKQAGVALGLFLCAATLLDALYMRKQSIHPIRYGRLRGFGTAALCVAATAGAYGSWQQKLNLDGSIKLFSEPVDLPVFWNAVSGGDAGYRGKSLEAFFRALFEGRQDIGIPGYAGFSFSWLALILGLLVVAVLLALAYRSRGRDMRRFDTTLAVLFVGCVLFAFGLAVSYLFQFTQAEALGLASFDRYMNIPLAMIAITLFLLGANLAAQPSRGGRRALVAILVVVLALAPLTELGNFALRRNAAYSKSVRAPYETVIRRVPELVDEAEAKISVVSIGSRDFDLQMLAFCLRPLHATDYSPETLALTEDDVCSIELTAEDWLTALERDEFDYVLLYRLNESFASEFSSAFAVPDTIAQGGLYRLNTNTGLLEHAGNAGEA